LLVEPAADSIDSAAEIEQFPKRPTLGFLRQPNLRNILGLWRHASPLIDI